jgi:ubiquinone/menaquinone biosynthesis C-methylase UbiE
MYTEEYDSELIRNPSYNISEYLKNFKIFNGKALDLGCGTCRKIIPLAEDVAGYYAIDKSELMLKKANENIKAQGIKNIFLLQGDNLYLPFPNRSFDIITCFLSYYYVPEIHRNLKKDGKIFIETLGANDKREIKSRFGKDEYGWRGILLNTNNAERILYLKKSLSPFFNNVNIEIFKFQTTIPREGFENLLKLTPTVRSFNPVRDSHIIDKLVDSNNNVTFNEERIVSYGEKK